MPASSSSSSAKRPRCTSTKASISKESSCPIWADPSASGGRALLKTEALPIGSTGADPLAVHVEGAGMIDLQPNCNHLAARSGQLRPSPVNSTDTGPLATFAQLAISAISRCGAGKIHRDTIQYAVQYKASSTELP